MLLAINEDSLKKLHCVISAYGLNDPYKDDQALLEDMIELMIEEAYGEMWKDVEKERYDEYTD